LRALNQFYPVTFRYTTYGLKLISDSPIPGLCTEAGPFPHSDLRVELSSEPQWVRDARLLPFQILQHLPASPETEDPAFVLTSFGEGQFFQLAYSDGACFVTDGEATRIWGTLGESQTMEDLSTYFLGPIMGFILRRRGVTALHASAFSMDGRAIVLTGDAGAGKSTTAAALALRGMPVLCEDIAAIEETDGNIQIELGHPRICLWPESVEMLMGRPDALPRLTPTWEKRYLALDGVQAMRERQKRPLGGVYLLGPREMSGDAPRIEEVNSRDVVVELVQNTYMNWFLDRGQRAAEFALLSHLVSQIPVRRVVPHRDSSRIGALCDLILADARRLLANQLAAAHTAGL
jgi:hypothetical protein